MTEIAPWAVFSLAHSLKKVNAALQKLNACSFRSLGKWQEFSDEAVPAAQSRPASSGFDHVTLGRSTMNPNVLQQENQDFQNTGGASRHNLDQGFRPAFSDTATGRVYLSCFANGSPAPFHLLDGLPDQVVLQRDRTGWITAVKATVIAGFMRAGDFYTREQAAQIVASAAGLQQEVD